MIYGVKARTILSREEVPTLNACVEVAPVADLLFVTGFHGNRGHSLPLK